MRSIFKMPSDDMPPNVCEGAIHYDEEEEGEVIMLLNLEQILGPAREHGFAVGGFNVTESTMFKAVAEQAEADKAPMIVQVSPNEFQFAEREQYLYFTARLRRSENPFVLHYDHGKTFEGCVRAVQAGFTSVMFDGSHLPYEENVRLTRKVAEMAHAAGVSVEGEIGSVGETADFERGIIEDMVYSTPEEACRFVRDTGIDALAVSVGTVHGLLPKGFVPCLQQELLKEIAFRTEVPLVLHGGSGTPEEQVAEACKNGISKVNISSEFKCAYYRRVRRFIEENPAVVSPTKVLSGGVEEVKRVVHTKLAMFGSVGKAGYYGNGAVG